MKKKFCILAGFVLSLALSMPQAVSAQTDSELLQAKLAKVAVIQADFKQQVINPEGELIQESSGELIISRPGNFHWQVMQPDEELIVSNGKDIWLYSPFIEQVTIMKFVDAVAGTPFVLLSGANASQWKNFDVKRSANAFVVINNEDKMNSNKFTFVFDENDSVNEFRVEDQRGQKSLFKLTPHKHNQQLTEDFFEFKIPSGIEIDDQR
jgi:outer membrane lipoprotein carrier protein